MSACGFAWPARNITAPSFFANVCKEGRPVATDLSDSSIAESNMQGFPGKLPRYGAALVVAGVCLSCARDRAAMAPDAHVAEVSAALTNAPVCYGATGVQASAPSPMVGLCPAHRNQSVAVAAQSA